ncbi:malonate decarboxylase holo-ACP synthase [Phytopseudomonas dryadis]|uniref:Phosphoribosyl-dephospho-CoA transferase n=1 Tax=Phytopseudomonas dryadis TaxID=2487520 RepID=A0ABY1Z674_9GAMM|nr:MULTISPECIES: malonate decarboxylase holo-ACP synthase [Pseudomonas]TBV05976.1 phosphoribosyl-dephospho-CoA transferase [Pseudomonas dryadis]TBV18117.1 phosphoribosyl-dephospho-CoA transferase [Pseudomonas sp. FRB 230]
MVRPGWDGRVRPHDLLWGLTHEHLPGDAPDWCQAALHGQPPAVVRRAPPRPGWVAVGLRGEQRGERYACWLPLAAVGRALCPEQLRACTPPDAAGLPVWQALCLARDILEGSGLTWGVTGSAAFELACGRRVTHAGSDLDLLLRTPEPLDPAFARRLLAQLARAPCRIDVQLQTPRGGVALAEWARAPARVMVKSEQGPLLLSDPWKEG